MADSLLAAEAIRLAQHATDRDDAIRQCGAILVEIGAVEPSYVEQMLQRERSISTYVGEGVAIPHGTNASKTAVFRDALAVVRFPDGVDWGGHHVTVCVAIAAKGDGHNEILGELADILLSPDRAAALRDATDPAQVLELLAPMQKETRQ